MELKSILSMATVFSETAINSPINESIRKGILRYVKVLSPREDKKVVFSTLPASAQMLFEEKFLSEFFSRIKVKPKTKYSAIINATLVITYLLISSIAIDDTVGGLSFFERGYDSAMMDFIDTLVDIAYKGIGDENSIEASKIRYLETYLKIVLTIEVGEDV